MRDDTKPKASEPAALDVAHDEVASSPEQALDDSSQDVVTGEPTRAGRRRLLVGFAVVVIALIVAGVAYAVYDANQSDDEIAAPVTGGAVTDSDQVVIEIPQEPSLMMVEEDGTLFVENDGNVTMSGVEVRDADGAAVCSLGDLAPGDRQPCEEAADAQGLVAVGTDPGGQEVQSDPE